jgi:hypothetical protein
MTGTIAISLPRGLRHNPPCGGLAWMKLSAALASTGLEFRFERNEKFFGHSETTAGYRFILNALSTDARLELVLGLKTASGEVIGGPYAFLARNIGLLSGRSMPEGAPYPPLPFCDQTTLAESVQFGVSLFKDVRRAILANPNWADAEAI